MFCPKIGHFDTVLALKPPLTNHSAQTKIVCHCYISYSTRTNFPKFGNVRIKPLRVPLISLSPKASVSPSLKVFPAEKSRITILLIIL